MSLTKVSYSMISNSPVNVLDYGADGTGATDSTSAIQAALTAAKAGNKDLYIPAGTYKVESALYLNGGITVYGDGLSSTSITRTSLTATVINSINVFAVFYVEGGWNHIRDMSISGVAGSTTGTVNGIQFGANIAAKGSIKNVAINWFLSGIVETIGVFLYVIENVQTLSCGYGFNFNSANQKTSLTISSCYAVNCGPAYMFNQVDYSTLNSCAADNCNWGTTSGNPYGAGYGAPTDSYGVYRFLQSYMTLNSIGAEGSYGNGVISTANSALTINSMWSTNCKSLYQPDYTSYPTYAVGPIQASTAANSLVINSPTNNGWTNTYVNTYSKPVASLVAFNFDEATFGVTQTTQVIVNGTVNETTVFNGNPSYVRYCKTIYSINNNVLTRKNNAVQVAGTGSTITIPITSQVVQNYTHSITIKGIDGTTAGTTALPFGTTIGCASSNVIYSVTSNNAYGITSVVGGTNSIVITLSSAHTNPIIEVNVISENASVVNVTGITIST